MVDKNNIDENRTLVSLPILDINGDKEDTTEIKRKPKRTGAKKVYAALIIIEGAEIGKQYFLRNSLYTIGRSDQADISIPSDALISRRHAQIEVLFDKRTKTTQYHLKDLKSTNHTYVNAEQISQKHLEEGDKINIGETTLKFVLEDDLDARFHKEVRKRIRYDSLTSLLTKESFYITLESELKRCRKNGFPLSLLMMDIDFFKKVNDTYGHQAGSFVLSKVGRLIRDNLRDFDLSARYGGEEFISMLVQTNDAQAFTMAERLRQVINDEEIPYDDKLIKITISIGVAQYLEDGETVKELVGRADKALYFCKKTGRNKVCTSAQADSNK